MAKTKDEYFVIDKDGNEQTAYGRHDVLGNITHGWLSLDEPAGGECLYYLPSGQKIIFPLPKHQTMGVNAQGQTAHVEIDEQLNEIKHSVGIWSLTENRPVLSARYDDILCSYPEHNLYVAIAANGHIQLLGDGDKLLADFAMPKNVWRWRNPSEEDPHFILTRGEDDWKRRAFNLLTGEKVGPAFRRIGELSEGVRYMQDSDERHLFVDADWNPLFELPHAPHLGGVLSKNAPDLNLKCTDGLIAVDCLDFCYLINRNGEVVIPPKKHKHIFTVGANRLLVSKGARYALADRTGKPLTDFLYKVGDHWGPYITDTFAENRLAVRKSLDRRAGKYGFIDEEGNEAIPFIYDMVPMPGHFSHGYTIVGVEVPVK